MINQLSGTGEQSFSNSLTMLVALHGDPLHVHASRGGVAVPECILRVCDRARLLGHDPCEAVPGLMEVDVAHTRLTRVALQVLDEGVRGERRPRPPRPVVPGPQR